MQICDGLGPRTALESNIYGNFTTVEYMHTTHSQQFLKGRAMSTWDVFSRARKSTDGRMQDLLLITAKHSLTLSSSDPYEMDYTYYVVYLRRKVPRLISILEVTHYTYILSCNFDSLPMNITGCLYTGIA